MKGSDRDRLEMWFWVAFAIPMLLFWRDSVLVVAIMSLYANWKTAQTAHEAAKAKEILEAQE